MVHEYLLAPVRGAFSNPGMRPLILFMSVRIITLSEFFLAHTICNFSSLVLKELATKMKVTGIPTQTTLATSVGHIMRFAGCSKELIERMVSICEARSKSKKKPDDDDELSEDDELDPFVAAALDAKDQCTVAEGARGNVPSDDSSQEDDGDDDTAVGRPKNFVTPKIGDVIPDGCKWVKAFGGCRKGDVAPAWVLRLPEGAVWLGVKSHSESFNDGSCPGSKVCQSETMAVLMCSRYAWDWHKHCGEAFWASEEGVACAASSASGVGARRGAGSRKRKADE
jgi:hypothetical protein